MVFVDDMRAPYGRMRLSHLLSDFSIDELHEMADRIGVSRRHFQSHSTPHYDVCEEKRLLAIEYGAVAIGYRSHEMVKVIRAARKLKEER